MPILIVVLGVIMLLLLITVGEINAFVSFVIVSLFVGLSMGLSLDDTVEALKHGIGDTMGLLVLILGFVILIPIVFTIAASTGLPLIFIGLPMLASLSLTHGFLPPHPAPTALKDFTGEKILADHELPSTLLSILAALMPVILIGISEIAGLFLNDSTSLYQIASSMGNPVIAMLLSLLFALFTLALRNGKKMSTVMSDLAYCSSYTCICGIGNCCRNDSFRHRTTPGIEPFGITGAYGTCHRIREPGPFTCK